MVTSWRIDLYDCRRAAGAFAYIRRFSRTEENQEKNATQSDVLFLVSSRIFKWNSLEADLITLYNNLIELGVEYRDGKVHLIDLDLEEQQDV